MIELSDGGCYLVNGTDVIPDSAESAAAVKAASGSDVTKEEARKGTIAYSILKAHNTSDNLDKLKISLRAMISHMSGSYRRHVHQDSRSFRCHTY